MIEDAPTDMFGKRDESGCPRKEASKPSEDFQLFWAIYPRQVAKLAARRAWDKALKIAPAEVIIDVARRYARECEHKAARFIKHPSTWLNGGGWMDAPGANTDHEQRYDELAVDLRARIDEEHGLPPGTTERQRAAEHARAANGWMDEIEAATLARGQR